MVIFDLSIVFYILFHKLFADSANNSAIEELRKQVNDLAQELNLVKEQQALQTGMHLRGLFGHLI